MRIAGSKAMTSNLNMNRRSIITLKEPQSHESTYTANINYVNKTISDNANVRPIMRSTSDYVRLNHSISSYDDANMFQYLVDNPSSEFSDEDDIKGVQVTNKDFHKVKTETYGMKLHLDPSKGFYSSRVGLNMYQLQASEYTVLF